MQWQEEYMHEYPSEFQKLDKNTYMQRKDIQFNYDEDGKVIGYKCLCRKITTQQYIDILEDKEKPTYNQVITESKATQDNQTLIMLALTDIYEKISKM